MRHTLRDLAREVRPAVGSDDGQGVAFQGSSSNLCLAVSCLEHWSNDMLDLWCFGGGEAFAVGLSEVSALWACWCFSWTLGYAG